MAILVHDSTIVYTPGLISTIVDMSIWVIGIWVYTPGLISTIVDAMRFIILSSKFIRPV